ncbi:hypothetical protein [Chamaesiphon polymorphus]|nr:hypothetical protein [Chamaesiphon polymorphus]
MNHRSVGAGLRRALVGSPDGLARKDNAMDIDRTINLKQTRPLPQCN